MDHSRAPVLDALTAYQDAGTVSFTSPGHKQGRGADPRVREVLGEQVFAHDLIALNGLDDRRMTGGVLSEAQGLMADAVDAEHTFFSTCGSSLSVKAAMLAVAGPGQRLLVARNAHKSVVAGLIVAGIDPVWVRPRYDDALHLAHPPGPEEVAEAFERVPSAEGMVLVSPTDYGGCADIAGVAEVCHAHDRVLIVDEAWGAHLPFHAALPAWGVDAGADLCVTSVHKMGAGIEQSSVFHLRGGRVDPVALKQREDLLGTTSSSVLVYAALDGWRRHMVEHGHEVMDDALALVRRLRDDIGGIDGLHVLGADDLLGNGRAHDFDPFKVVVDVSGLGVTGFHAAEWVRAEHAVTVGLSDHRRVVAQVTYADDERSARRLCRALDDLSRRRDELEPAPPLDLPTGDELAMPTVQLPRDAYFTATEDVALADAVGRVAAEMVSPYPPGVPVVLPGEQLTRPVAAYLRDAVRAGAFVPDAANASLETLRVVA